MQSSPIPSPRAEARRSRPWLAAAGLAVCLPLAAHELTEDPLPDLPGWRIGAALAVTAIGAQDPIPSPTLPGVLTTGVREADLRGLKIEHATLAGSVRVNEWFGASASVGWHADGNAHMESVWFEARQATDSARWRLGAGRNKVYMGPVLTRAGDYDRFSLTPLVKRASLNTDWYDNGAMASWRNDDEDSLLQALDFGLWQGQGFPGGGDLPPVPSLHLQLGLGEWQLDGFYAYLQPDGRGSLVQGPNSPGHIHNVPNCNFSMSGLVCFDGTVNLVGGSFAWAPHDGPVSVSGALLFRDERGSLYSTLGDAAYHGQTLGGWLDVAWDFRPDWQLALRYEGLSAKQSLTGPAALLVGIQAGLYPNWPASRGAMALAWSPAPGWRLSTELGAERGSGQTNPYVMLRAVWLMPDLLSGRW